MTGINAQRVYAALQRPDAAALHDALPDMADGLHTQLCELHARPGADRCDRLLLNLEGAVQYVRVYREALVAEGEGHGP